MMLVNYRRDDVGSDPPSSRNQRVMAIIEVKCGSADHDQAGT